MGGVVVLALAAMVHGASNSWRMEDVGLDRQGFGPRSSRRA